jgi:AcrR family transcriptional regulator
MARTRKPLSRRPAHTTARRRRPPELARQEILDAAERVFAIHQPDQVGLKEVAQEAGVSHALITHYFGTYAGLLEAALERRIRATREAALARLREPEALSRPGELLGLLFRVLADPVHLRLMRWLLASERPAASRSFALQDRGLAIIADQIARALSPEPSPALVDDVEIALLTAVSAAYGYALAKHVLAGALGREPSRELDDQVREALGAMVHTHLRGRH